MSKINLHLYSGLLDVRSIKTIKVLEKKFDEFYLSGIGSKKFFLKNNFSKIKQIYLSSNKNIIFWYIKNIIFFKKKNIKLINVHSVGALPLGVLLKIIHSSILIYDAHELESDTSGKSKFYKFIAKLFEILFLRYVNHTFVVSKGIAKWYQQKYKIKKPTVIYNSPVLNKIKKKDIFRKKFKIDKKQIIYLYQGGLSINRGVEIILDAFSKRKCKKSVVIFMGSGPLTSLVKKYSLNYKNIFYHPEVDYDILLNYTSSANFGLSITQNKCLSHYHAMPNKLFEYISAGVTPIVSTVIDQKNFVNLYNCGYVVSPNPKSLNNMINRVNKINLNTKTKNCIIAAKLNSWKVQEKKLILQYNDIFNEN